MPNNSWTQLASFPGAGRDHPAMVNVGDKIFVGCGSNASSYGLSDWWEYDITNNSWVQKTDIPGNGRHHPYYFGIGNYAYVGFGHGSVSGEIVIFLSAFIASCVGFLWHNSYPADILSLIHI